MDHDTLQKPKDQKDTSKPAATLSLNVYTETFNRSLQRSGWSLLDNIEVS